MSSPTLEAKLTLATAPFTQALGEVEKTQQQSTARMTAAQQKAQREAEKSAKASAKAESDARNKAFQEEEQRLKERASLHKEAFSNVTSGLASAESTGDVLSTGFKAIGGLVGPFAIAALAAGTIAKGMYDASKSAREMHRELSSLGGQSVNMTGAGSSSGDLLGQAGKIGDKLQSLYDEKEAAKRNLPGFMADSIAGSQSNSVVGSMYEAASDRVGAMTGKKGAREDQLDQMEKLNTERKRLMDAAAESANDDLEAMRDRVKLGEREGALEESRLRTAREIATVEREMGRQGFGQAEIEKFTLPMAKRGKMEQREINRTADEAERDAADGIARAKEQAGIEATSLRDELKAAEQQVTMLENEAAKKRGYANGTMNEDRKRGYNKDADGLDIQAGQARLKLTELQRAQEERMVDLQRSREQSQISLLSVTGQEVSARAQMELLTKRIVDNTRRMEYANQEQKLQLQGQNAQLDAQIKQLAIADALKSPAQRTAERAASRRGRRAEHLVKARAHEAADALKRGATRVRRGDAVLRSIDRPKGTAEDLGRAMDGSQLAKDIRTIAQAVNQPAKAG